MRPISLAAAALTAAALAASPALADRKNEKGNKGHRGEARASFCPPGLSKKDPACVPPGQARKARVDDHDDDRWRNTRWDDGRWRDHDDDSWRDRDRHGDRDGYRGYRIGDRIDDRFIRVDDPYRYGLNPDYYYYRTLDQVFRVDPETRQVLAIIGLVDAILN
jgi:hypothetical protein